jgi:hypothetical protein
MRAGNVILHLHDRTRLRVEGARHAERNAIPLRGFLFQLPAARAGQRVLFRPAVVLGRLPGRGEPARLLEAVESREQGSELHDERAACDLLNSAGASRGQLRIAELASDECGPLYTGWTPARQGIVMIHGGSGDWRGGR